MPSAMLPMHNCGCEFERMFLATGDEQRFSMRGHADQAAGMRMATALVWKCQNAGSSPRADMIGAAAQVKPLRSRKCSAPYLDAAGFRQRRADGIGTAVLLVPGRAALQCHSLGLAQKIGIAQRVHQRAQPVGKNDHALGMADLLEKMFHHRARVGEQIMVAGRKMAHVAGAGMGRVGQTPGRREARIQTASPRTGDPFVDCAGKAVTVFQQMIARLAQGRHGNDVRIESPPRVVADRFSANGNGPAQ